jgi:excisionase family DNA binding protein
VSRPELLTAEEAAKVLRIKTSTLREHTRRGLVPHLRIGRAVRYDAVDLVAWLETQKQPMKPS